MEVATLGGRGTRDGVRGVINIIPEVPSTLGKIRVLEGDGEGTVAGLAVDTEMYAAEAGTDSGGALPPSGFIV